MYDVWGNGDWLFTVGPIFIGIIFFIIFIGIIVSLFSGLRQWKINRGLTSFICSSHRKN